MEARPLPSLTDNDPPPFTLENEAGAAPVLIICDHAGRAVPELFGRLGLTEDELARHIGWDIGAAEVTRGLAARLNAPAVLATYSRLVIDLNRQPGHPTSICPLSDGIVIPANQGLDDAQAEWRQDAFFWPYHNTVTRMLGRLWRHGMPPALIGIHSFTPEMNGFRRPWHVGVLWNRDGRMALPLMERLRARGDLYVGDNEPYSGRDIGFSIERHAGAAGLPHVSLEIRQDLIGDEAGAARWTDILAEALAPILADPGLHRVEVP